MRAPFALTNIRCISKIRIAKCNYTSNTKKTHTFSKEDLKDVAGFHSSNDKLAVIDESDNKPLPFSAVRYSDTFGKLVTSDKFEKSSQLNDLKGMEAVKIVNQVSESPFRNEDGTLIKGSSSEEARLHNYTLKGRMDRKVSKLPPNIISTINDEFLRRHIPDRLRERSALIYQSMSKEQIQKAPQTSLDCDAFIASLFAQDFAHVKQVISELQTRVGKESFHPARVLDVGYGPATGMLALNDLMGDDYKAEVKDAYIIGRNNTQMKRRAKVLLSRQRNELNIEEQDTKEEADVESENQFIESDDQQIKHNLSSAETEEEADHERGEIDTSKINIHTRLRDSLPATKMYDLIIVNQALLTREYHFHKDIDTNVFLLMKLLAPGGHLVLVERGTALGFETVARARQVMIRPESYPGESGKIPRPYIRASTKKPQKLRKEDELITDEDIEYEKKLLLEMEGKEYEKKLDSKFGETSDDDLKLELEESQEYDVIKVEDSTASEGTKSQSKSSVDFHVSIIAPCSHHRKCPLQLGDPKYYRIPSHRHRLKFCSFSKTIERPSYTMELKKGRRLALQWNKQAEDGFGIDQIDKDKRKKLEGTGRSGSNNKESGSYSYIVAQRAFNDEETIKKIDDMRKYNSSDIMDKSDLNNWPRIIDSPTKVKKNIKLNVCAPSGKIEVWQIPKSFGKQEYHDARKAAKGDLWGLSRKSSQAKNEVSDKVKTKLEFLAKAHKKKFLKDESKKRFKKLVSSSANAFEEKDAYDLADELATSLESSKLYKTKGRRANYDVDLAQYDGK